MKKLLVIFAVLACSAYAESTVPSDFGETFSSLAGLVDREELGALDMARGTYDAARFIAVGAPGVPWLEPRFKKAASFGEAAVAGIYMTVWGRAEQLYAIQRELETNPLKRKWLYALVGTEEHFAASLSGGAAYQPMLRLLPSVGGSRALTMNCIKSKDALVRRAGLFWGYWLADASYWNAVKALAKTETDRTTLRLVQQLLLKHSA